MEGLKEDIVQKIKADQKLQGEVAFEMGVSTISMYSILKDNGKDTRRGKKLIHPNVLKLLSKKLGVPVTDLVEDQVAA